MQNVVVLHNCSVSETRASLCANGRQLVEAVWDLFEQSGSWPTVGEVAHRLDRRYDLAFEDALPDVPAGLLYGVHPGRIPSDGETIGLTLAGAAAVEGAAEDLQLVVAAIGLAARLQQTWDPPTADRDTELSFTASDLARHEEISTAGRALPLARVGALLRTENWGWSSASHGVTPDAWSFTIDRRVRRFRGVVNFTDLCSRVRPPSQLASPPLVASEAVMPPATGRLSTLTAPAEQQTNPRSSVTKRTVFLVHGRDHDARNALIELLRAFDLRVINWRDAISQAGEGGTPYTGDIVRAGMDMADVVVVLLTPDDVGYVRPAFRQDRDGADELRPTGQARLNVIFEAGMAMALDRKRVVMVEIGATRGLSDTAGIHTIRLSDHVESRKDFAARLRDAGLTVDTDGEPWRTVGVFTRSPLAARELALEPDTAPGSPSDRADQAGQEEGTVRLTNTLLASRLGRLNTPYSTDVVGEVTNESTASLNVVLLSATFLDSAGRIVGTADGAINGLTGGATKSFRLMSAGVVEDVATFTIQSNGQM